MHIDSYREAIDLIKHTILNKIINNDDSEISAENIIKNKIIINYEKYTL